MAEAPGSTQLPLGGISQKSVIQEELEAFQQGIEVGRQHAELALRRAAAWAEENPGQMIVAGLAAGFVLGKLLFRPRRVRIPDLDLE